MRSALLYVFVLLGPASSELSPDMFLRCFTQEQTKAFSIGPFCEHFRSCRDTLLVHTQDTNFTCLLPDDENDLRINYTARSSCNEDDKLNLTHFDGSISCPSTVFNQPCVRFLQTISGCYSYILFASLKIKSIVPPNVTVTLEQPMGEQQQENCSENTLPANCNSAASAGSEYRILELQNHGRNDGARYFLPVSNNVPIDCSQLENVRVAHAPAFGFDLPESSICNTYGQSRKGPCILINSRIARIELPTLPLENGACPAGYCHRGCRCIFAGSILETEDCPYPFSNQGSGSLFDFPEKPKNG